MSWAPAQNCYCGGPEEIYPHRRGAGLYCKREDTTVDELRPGDVWLVKRDEVPDEEPTIAEYHEWDEGDVRGYRGYWRYFGTEWLDPVDGSEKITVTPVKLVHRPDSRRAVTR